jgi:hypothetical protein
MSICPKVSLLLFLFYLAPGLSRAEPLIKHLSDSIRLNRAEKEKAPRRRLKELNGKIKEELEKGNITDILNRIEKKGLEEKALAAFVDIIGMRKHYNDIIQKRLEQKEYGNDIIKNAYRQLMVDLIPGDIKKLAYLYPVIMPFANYLQPESVKIDDIDLLENEKIYKYHFFYLYRKYADMKKTGKFYNSLYSGVNISVDQGPLRLEKFFDRDVGFGFFDDKFDTGIFNKQSKFFAFDGYTYKYLKDEHKKSPEQSVLIKIFKTYCVYKAYCNNCDLLKFYNARKTGMFEDISREMEHHYTTPAIERYTKPLYYLCRTFPNISAFILTRKDEKYKFTAREKKSPTLEQLKTLWKKIEANEKNPANAVKLLQYTLGSIYLLPQKEVLPANEDYSFDRSGYATYMQEYIAVYNKYRKSAK